MAEQNSISTLLPELLRLFNNSLTSFQSVNEAITSDSESVTIDIQNEDGTITKLTIPSFGFLKNSINRLDNNIETITNLTGSGSSIRLPDGTFRKLVLAKLPTEANDLNDLNSVESFNFKSNWFFEELINPLIYVNFNLTGQVPIDIERTEVKRYILDLNTQSKINFFENELQGRSDIDYNSFLEELVRRNITYILDQDVLDIPPRQKRFTGTFSVIRISDIEVTEEINGTNVTSTRKLYKLNKISYTDTESDFSDTVQLKVGDSLELVTDPIDTRYSVIQIDSSTNSVVLELVEGSKSIGITSELKISSAIDENVEAEVPVGFDERCVVFIKPIDPDSKIPAVNWSPGSAFYTNTLTTISSGGESQTLKDFYQSQVVDFGKYLLSFANDKIPTSREGLIPNPPTLVAEDFQVKLINRQLTDSNSIVEIQDLNNQKNTLQSELKELDRAIAQKRTRINTTNYSTDVQRDSDKNELTGLINERTEKSELYSSLVNQIASIGTDNSTGSISPKYRVRGFFPLPAEKSSPETGTQEIVKFITRYRYLSQDGAANPVDEIEFTDGEGSSQGAFSNYKIIESTIRSRELNSLTGNYEWATINVENADEININQVDIPIRKGELVEFQVKSISEAGWPGNPLESEWSNSVRIEFPADLSSDDVVATILEENQQDQTRINLQNEVSSQGISEHIESSFSANEKYFAHDSSVISSGFFNDQGTPVDLFLKLTELQNEINSLNEILSDARGELKVTLIDENGQVTNLQRDTVTKVFGGFYANEVDGLDDPRGAIVTKTYFVNISNIQQTTLQLISSITGNRERMVRQSENPNFTSSEASGGSIILPAVYPYLDNSSSNQSDNIATYSVSDSNYNIQRKYDLSPIILTNPDTGTEPYGQIKSIVPYQSTQNKNQFLYVRFKDISSEEVFYNYVNPENEYSINLDTCENFYGRSATTNSSGFFWGGGFNDSTGAPVEDSNYFNSDDNSIEVHIEHPLISDYATFRAAYIELTGDTATLPSAIPASPGNVLNCTSSGNRTGDVLFRHSKFIPLKSDESKGKQQSIYLNENVNELAALPGTGNWPSTLTTPDGNSQNFESSPSLSGIDSAANFARNGKTSFDTFDQYLLGKKSCGSYLFISTDDHNSIQVDGDATTSKKPVQFGSQNSLNIPLTFQYRMTDYYGSGSGSSGGLGNIAGDTTGSVVNLIYAKRIGFDIYTPSDNDLFQFDVEVFAKYRSDNLNTDVFPSASIERGLQDLNQTLTGLGVNSINETGN